MTESFDRLVTAALQQPILGWDFSQIASRFSSQAPSWDYRERVIAALPGRRVLLDMDTGGGEWLSSLPDKPARVLATEKYTPNILIAKQRLAPLGIELFALEEDAKLPFDSASIDLIINRHGSFCAQEIARVLTPGGRFITQQVGGDNDVQLNQHLGANYGDHSGWNLTAAVQQLSATGLKIITQHEEYPLNTFQDIGAVVFYLQAVPWQVPSFSVATYRQQLLALHQLILQMGCLTIRGHRFFIECSLSN